MNNSRDMRKDNSGKVPFFVHSPEDALSAGKIFFQLKELEGNSTHILYLDGMDYQVVGFQNLENTRLNKVDIKPSTFFSPAFEVNAGGAVIIHKRAIESLVPEAAEFELLKALEAAGKELSVKVHDLIYVNCKNEALSVREKISAIQLGGIFS